MKIAPVLLSLVLSTCALQCAAAPSDDLRLMMKSRGSLTQASSLEAVEQFIKANPAVVNQEMPRVAGTGKILPLHEALTMGDIELVSIMLRNGADPNKLSGGRQPQSSFDWAINDLVDPDKISKAVELLLASKASPNLPDSRGLTALHRWSARRSWQDHRAYALIAEQLFQAGAKTGAVDKLGFTPLMVATTNENSAAVRILLQHGADVSQKTKMGTVRELAQQQARRGSAKAKEILALLSGSK